MDKVIKSLPKMSTPETLVLIGEIVVAILFIVHFTIAKVSTAGALTSLIKRPLARFLIVAIIAVVIMYNIPIGFMIGMVYLSVLFRGSAYESFAVSSEKEDKDMATDMMGTEEDIEDDEELGDADASSGTVQS